MAAIDFPASPSTGDLFSVSATGVTYRWNGTLWLVQAGPGGGTGDFCATKLTGGAGTAALSTLIPNTIVSGNAGNWYSTSTGRYVPPAGRFYIAGFFTGSYASGAAHIVASLRKNGVEIASATDTPNAANQYGQPVVSAVVDSNGTDYFELQGMTQGVVGNFGATTFQAFPLTGMQGPAGAGGGGASLTVSDTAPGSPTAGAMWWNSVLGTLFFYYQDVDSSQWVPASPAAVNNAASVVRTTVFTSSGTWTPDANMVYAVLKAVGGGGGGGGIAAGSAGAGYTGSGGGAGSFSVTTVSKAAAGASQVVTIGAAGTAGPNGGTNGGNGGDTSVGTLCVGKGGGGGPSVNGSTNPSGGLGGVVGTGDETSTGAPGQSGGIPISTSIGAAGGSSPWGGGGRGVQTAGGSSIAGVAGGGWGAGGGGASGYDATAVARAGGAGSAGKVIIIEYCTV